MNTPRMDLLVPNLFLDGPTQYMAKVLAAQLSLVPQFKTLFGDAITPYERLDYGAREFPALRIYNGNYRKEQESHYITGEMILDVIYPASIRREELQLFPDVVSSALLQQFRRVPFFELLKTLVPGLNELGKTFDVNKNLGFKWEDGYLPLTEIKANLRIDLKAWDDYLEAQDRTMEEPFTRTLKELGRIVSTIKGEAGNEPDASDVIVSVDQKID